MIIRKLTGDHDWTFGKGLNSFAIDEKAIEENIDTRVLSWVGDCFFALQEGVDWRSRLDIGQQDELVEEVKSVILQSEGVVGVNSIELEFNGTTRVATITYNIQTIYSRDFQRVITQLAGVRE
jgi:hypothetical protein